jgi:glycine betaine/proline transport system ATP-binding protein
VNTKIKLESVVKIFGRNPRGRPLEMLREGKSIGEIRAETGHVVGVAGVTVDIMEGEVFVVMGLSGSGKSTLIRCINRIHEPTAGAVIVDGEDLLQVDLERMRQVRREKMSMVFQHFALFPHKTVIENAGFGLKVQDIDEKERNARAMDALELVGLGEWAQRYPHNLSGGMQQRVGLARALATDPDILLMDEAFSALDPLIRRQMQNELLDLQDKVQKTIVFITHDLNEALRIGSRVMIMKEGAVVQVGTPTEIVTEPEDPVCLRLHGGRGSRQGAPRRVCDEGCTDVVTGNSGFGCGRLTHRWWFRLCS